MKKMIEIVSLLFLPYLLVGCNSLDKEPKFSDTSDPFSYLHQYINHDEKGLINLSKGLSKLYLATSPIQYKEYAEHRTYYRRWCSKDGKQEVIKRIDLLCKFNDGYWNGDWCTNKENHKKMFALKVIDTDSTTRKGCDYSELVRISAMFPATDETYESSSWQSFVKKYTEMAKE